jgi:uncharacterized membrane protein
MPVRPLCFVLAFAVTMLIAIPAAAEDSAEIAQPVLIVWAKTDLPNNGSPVVDLQDLERYFKNQLMIRGFEHVFPAATTKLSNPPGANEYLLELSVDALQSATRATRDERGAYQDDPVFVVELSVTVRQPLSGQVFGKRLVPLEYHMSKDELQELGPKRHALYTTADRLAQFFADEVSEGKLGEPLKLSQRPLSMLEQTQLFLKKFQPWQIIVGIVVFVLVLMLILNAIGWVMAPPTTAASNVSQTSATKAETPPKRKWDFDKQLSDALALAIATDKFSKIACRAAAVARREEVLKNAAAIEAAEAKRRLELRSLHAEYDKIAKYGAQFSWLDEKLLWEMLGKAAEWPFLVLQEAKKIQQEEGSYEQQS